MPILVSEVTIGPAGVTSRTWEVPAPLEPGADWVEVPAPEAPPWAMMGPMQLKER
jgi:hypothetical protein